MELVEEGEDLGVEAVRVHVDDGGHAHPGLLLIRGVVRFHGGSNT